MASAYIQSIYVSIGSVVVTKHKFSLLSILFTYALHVLIALYYTVLVEKPPSKLLTHKKNKHENKKRELCPIFCLIMFILFLPHPLTWTCHFCQKDFFLASYKSIIIVKYI